MASPRALYRFIYKDKLVLWLLYLPAGNFFQNPYNGNSMERS
jgi:hypothetical protein